MRTIETTVYKFDELSETAKQKALESFYDINVDYEWWEFIYDDAKNVGIKITGFDLDRRKNCEGKFYDDAEEVANKILQEHGDTCETYKTAKAFLGELANIESRYKGRWSQYNDETPEDEREYDDFDDYFEQEAEYDIEDAKNDFKKYIFSDYANMLQENYEYLTSEEAIIESIEANEYEFTENGKLI